MTQWFSLCTRNILARDLRARRWQGLREGVHGHNILQLLCSSEQHSGQWRNSVSLQRRWPGGSPCLHSPSLTYLNVQRAGEWACSQAKQWVPLWAQLSASKRGLQPTSQEGAKKNSPSPSQQVPSAQNEWGLTFLPSLPACQPTLHATVSIHPWSFKKTNF